MGTVVMLCRYPVTSMLGETLAAADVTCAGPEGDRTHAVLDGTGAVGSVKHPRKRGPLLGCRSRVAADGGVEVVPPGGPALRAGDPALDARLSDLLGRPVALSADPRAHGVLERALPGCPGGVPDAQRATASTDGTGERITVGAVAPGTFFDFGRLHLVTTASLAALRSAYPGGDVDARRFRPNLVVDTGGEPGFPEDGWPGRHVRVGGALCRVTVPTPRCAVPALRHGELPPDAGIMRTAARHHRIPVLDLGPLTCLGVYLDVLEPGTVRTGDPFTVVPAP